jgi:hypothetical protein
MAADIHTQRDRRLTIEATLIALRARAACPHHRSNRSDIFWHCIEQRLGVAPKSKVLAARLKCSESQISRAIRAAQAELDRIIKS